MTRRLLALVVAAAGLGPAGPAVAQGLPVVSIEPQERIQDDRRVRARVRLPGYDGWGAIEIRGQSSAGFRKKSYALELRDARDADRDASLLGMPADDDWVLYAAHNDKTLMRNVVAYAAARAMGRWAAATRYVEVRLGGRYHGIYVLMERPELNAARIDVPGRGLTGDYLFEFTFPFQAGRKGAHFLTPVRRRPIVWEDPERADLAAGEARYTRTVLGRVERALYSGRRGAWKQVLDPGAAVDYVLTQELFRNIDAFHASTYLTKPAGGLLRLGPVWDFDLSSDNTRNQNGHRVRGWLTAGRDWASQLHRDRSFRRALGNRWKALRAAGFRQAVLREIDRAQRVLRPHVDRQFARWPVLDRLVWPNAVARGSHGAEVRALRTWLSRRMRWIDAATGHTPPTRASRARVAGAGSAQARSSGRALPVVRLTTERRIRNEPKVSARVRVEAAAGGYDGLGAVEIRGQTSRSFPKKSFALELRDAEGRSRDAGLLGMAADDDWILYAAYNDKSLMRNVLAYRVARAMGQWAARTRYVEVHHNRRYLGVYVLMERPELSGGRLDVPGAGLTGEYLVELTMTRQARIKGPFFRTPVRRRPVVFEDPEHEDLSAAERRYVRAMVGGAERALYSGRSGAWRTRLDPRAAVDYVLLQELFRNHDAFLRSTYMHKPAGARLRLGPVWDFDVSSGNTTVAANLRTAGWHTDWRDWAGALHRDRTFRAALAARWRTLRAAGFRERVRAEIDRAAREVRPAVARNFRRWPILRRRVYHNPVARGSWPAEVRALRQWLTARMAWLDRVT